MRRSPPARCLSDIHQTLTAGGLSWRSLPGLQPNPVRNERPPPPWKHRGPTDAQEGTELAHTPPQHGSKFLKVKDHVLSVPAPDPEPSSNWGPRKHSLTCHSSELTTPRIKTETHCGKEITFWQADTGQALGTYCERY